MGRSGPDAAEPCPGGAGREPANAVERRAAHPRNGASRPPPGAGSGSSEGDGAGYCFASHLRARSAAAVPSYFLTMASNFGIAFLAPRRATASMAFA